MAERIDIVVSERGSRTVRRNIDGIGSSATGAQGAVQLLRRALVTIGSVAAVRELVRLVDTFTNLQNRLRIVTTGTAQLGVVTDRLFEIANRTRQSFEGTTEVFARTALALKDIGVSSQKTLEFTESLNQAVILSGASAQESQAGLIQLSQGLASGTLRGDELRSVLEQLPAVADVISKSLGITRGELRLMGNEGKITSKIILDAFAEAREELAQKFAKTVPTIGQSFTVLRNNVVRFVGELSTSSGAVTIVSRALLTLAENIDTVGRAFGAAALTIGVVFGVRAIGAAISGLKALSLAILANPLGALLIAITSTISLLVAFGDQMLVSADSVATVADFLGAAWDESVDALTELLDVASSVFSEITGLATSIVGPVNLSFSSIVRFLASVVDGIVGSFKGAFQAIVATFDRLPAALGDVFFLALRGVTSIVESALNALIGGVNRVTEFFGFGSVGEVTLNVNNPFAGEARQAGQIAAAAFQEGFESVTFATNAVDRVLKSAEERAQDRLRREEEERAARARAEADLGTAGVDKTAGQQSQKLKDLIRDLQRESEVLLLSNDERALRETLFKAEDAAGRKLSATETTLITNLVKQNQQLQVQRALLDEIQGPAEDFAKQQEALNSLLRDGAITQGEFNKKLREMKIAFLDTQVDTFSGFERGFLKAQQSMEDFASTSERLITDAFQGAQDAVVEFFQTGKFEADDFFRQLSANFLKLGTQQLFASAFGQQSPLGGLLGGGGGGGIGGLVTGLLGFQSGASNVPVDALSAASLGGVDNRLVAFRARSDETVSVHKRGEGGNGGRPLQISFNFPPGTDVDSFRRAQGNIAAQTSATLSRYAQRNN